MAFFSVTVPELRSTVSTLREYNQNFKAQVENLVNAEGTLNTQWEGAARDAFHNSFVKDKSFMDAFAAEMERYCAALEAMASEYEKREVSNVEIANSRRG